MKFETRRCPEVRRIPMDVAGGSKVSKRICVRQGRTVMPDQAFRHPVSEKALSRLSTGRPRGAVEYERVAFGFPSVPMMMALVFTCLVTQACGGGSAGDSTPPQNVASTVGSITVLPSVSSIEIGQTQQYAAVVKDANGNILNGVTVTWSSSHRGVATIDGNGLAQGLSPGTTTPIASRNGITSRLVNLSVTSARASGFTPLPPWLTYCDTGRCASIAPVVVYVCPASSPACFPARTTTIVPQVDDKPISGVIFPLAVPVDTDLRLVSGNGNVVSNLVWAFQASNVIFGSDQNVLVSYYNVAPVWGGTTPLNFTSTRLTSALLDSVFYRHPSYDTGTAAIDLHTQGQTVIMTERTITGLASEHVTAFFMPTELAAVQGEGNFSYGNGTVTINYGNPPYIAARGGIANTAMPRFAHEYAHELFNEIRPALEGDPSCLNEGTADALAYASGFLPEEDFGPVGVRAINFDSGCAAVSEIHDVGNCYFWHVKKAGLLSPGFLYGIFHPQHTFSFNSCAQNTIETGNNILVYFTEAVGGANMAPVLESMKIPHAGSYDAAKRAIGL